MNFAGQLSFLVKLAQGEDLILFMIYVNLVSDKGAVGLLSSTLDCRTQNSIKIFQCKKWPPPLIEPLQKCYRDSLQNHIDKYWPVQFEVNWPYQVCGRYWWGVWRDLPPSHKILKILVQNAKSL
jgi:hypothetical protein